MKSTRRAAVAGLFYPASPRDLEARVRRFLEEAAAPIEHAGVPPPKALIVPHAGYPYSGAVAAAAYARLERVRNVLERVVLIGPAHRVSLRGFAASASRAFATPLGKVPIDGEAVAAVLALPQVQVLEDAHAGEHCLEVQLPFLQIVLDAFQLVPLVAGDTTYEEAARVLDGVWGGPETLIVVSSDLSHYHDDATARGLDARTAAAVEALDPEAIPPGGACGRLPLGGLLAAARRRGLHAATVALQNSAAVSGDRSHVVGYGAFVLA